MSDSSQGLNVWLLMIDFRNFKLGWLKLKFKMSSMAVDSYTTFIACIHDNSSSNRETGARDRGWRKREIVFCNDATSTNLSDDHCLHVLNWWLQSVNDGFSVRSSAECWSEFLQVPRDGELTHVLGGQSARCADDVAHSGIVGGFVPAASSAKITNCVEILEKNLMEFDTFEKLCAFLTW